jgi:hypothetical protein
MGIEGVMLCGLIEGEGRKGASDSEIDCGIHNSSFFFEGAEQNGAIIARRGHTRISTPGKLSRVFPMQSIYIRPAKSSIFAQIDA